MNSDEPPVLETLTWREAQDALALRPIGLLPVGAIEAHGPHLPLNTDIIIAQGMALTAGRLLRKTGLPSLILPSISYSVSYAGACFPGTTPVTAEAFEAHLIAVLQTLAAQGYRVICLCNAHLEPAHVSAVASAVNAARSTAEIPILFPDKRIDRRSSELGAEFTGGSRHAGSYETSIVMAVDPGSVRRAALEGLHPVWIDLPAALQRGARDFAEAGAELGYFGDPAAASPEEGKRLLAVLAVMVHDHVLEALARNE